MEQYIYDIIFGIFIFLILVCAITYILFTRSKSNCENAGYVMEYNEKPIECKEPPKPQKKIKFKMYHDLTVYPRKTYYQCTKCGSYNVTQLNIYAAGLLASTTDIKCDDCFAVHDREMEE